MNNLTNPVTKSKASGFAEVSEPVSIEISFSGYIATQFLYDSMIAGGKKKVRELFLTTYNTEPDSIIIIPVGLTPWTYRGLDYYIYIFQATGIPKPRLMARISVNNYIATVSVTGGSGNYLYEWFVGSNYAGTYSSVNLAYYTYGPYLSYCGTYPVRVEITDLSLPGVAGKAYHYEPGGCINTDY